MLKKAFCILYAVIFVTSVTSVHGVETFQLHDEIPPKLESLGVFRVVFANSYHGFMNGELVEFRTTTGRQFTLQGLGLVSLFYSEKGSADQTKVSHAFANDFHCLSKVPIFLQGCYGVIVREHPTLGNQIVYYSKQGEPVFWSIGVISSVNLEIYAR